MSLKEKTVQHLQVWEAPQLHLLNDLAGQKWLNVELKAFATVMMSHILGGIGGSRTSYFQTR